MAITRTKLNTVALAAAIAAMTAGAGYAQQVSLQSYDGSITLRGDLLEFDGQNYQIATAIGTITIDANQVSCEGDACPAPELLMSEFRIAGSDTIGVELMPALIEGYSFALDADIAANELNADGSIALAIEDLGGTPLADIEIAIANSGAGFQELLSGAATIGMASRPIRPREAAAFQEASLGNPTDPAQEFILALDGLLVITARSNPVRNLSIEEMGGIFAGDITNWAEVGGLNAPINVYTRESGSGTRTVFEANVMELIGADISDDARVFDDNADLSDAVAADPFGIGFTGYAAERNARAVGVEEVCGIVTQPTVFNIKAEEYPLARRLFLYTTNAALPNHARNLLEFTSSDAAQDIIADAGFIDQAISGAPMAEQGLRLASGMLAAEDGAQLNDLREFASTMLNAERLSTTLRFQPGSSLLDAKAQRDVVRIAELLARGAFDNKEVMLVGFTDSIGRPDLNQALSERRAEQVFEAIVAAAPGGGIDDQAITVLGYGEISPVGCNETFAGRQVNRRVEIWVRDRI
ncbi:substrate-binding domain-containing protein [Pontivivens insulae]|uniref:Phosphate-binding protein PstS n=1 Tax=Pontivivens insulae TaxID=1639689 RepID=A0A2R8A7K1_9RHOB|nr:phosphate ABC transporter substrate-binding/OmpA family protein [Pontivivens insulae]RED18111.1 phosphate ABC transporter substrate-binding protein (PhoT family) [Pontivivens insulae]SPF28008.1 Phosphate-binding protein PstS [Pontivivens insulae]